MPWFKVDDGFHGHPKVVEVGLEAVGLWTLAGSWCAKYLTDGFVPDKTVTRLGGTHDQAKELVVADLWSGETGGYQFKDWEDYQPLKADVEAERAAAQERMRKVRASRKGVRANETRTDAEPMENNGEGSPEVRVTPSQSQSLPIPTSSSTKKSGAARRKPEVPLPDDWTPKPAHVQLAHERGVNGPHEEAQFRAHAAANDRRQRDWDAAFRGWLGNARPVKATPTERAKRTVMLATELLEVES